MIARSSFHQEQPIKTELVSYVYILYTFVYHVYGKQKYSAVNIWCSQTPANEFL